MRWTACSPLPNAMWWAHATVIDFIMYVGGGECRDDCNMLNVYAYHLIEDKWDILPPLRQYHGVPVSIAKKLTIIGGRDAAIPYKRTSRVTTFINGVWRNDLFPNLLTERSWPAVVSYQSYIIVAGGCGDDGTVLDTIEVLDISHAPLQWRIVNTQLPQPMYTPSATVCGESLIIVGFGTADNKCSNEAFLIYMNEILSQPQRSSGNHKWTTLPDALHWKTALISTSSHPVIIGGCNGQQKAVKDVTVYDDTTKNWRKVSTLPTNFTFPVATTINNCIIVAGGCKNAKDMKTANDTCSTKVFKGCLEEIH